MELEDVQVSFICPNVDGFYEKGQLRLAQPFYVDFCADLPPIVKLHDPMSLVWKGNYVKKSKCITDLSSMMSYYGIKPYHMVLLSYKGGQDFHFQVYNPYAVEIVYSVDKRPFNVELDCTPVEVDKLGSIFSYNAFSNFGAVHRFVVKPQHVLGCKFTEVLPRLDCEKIGLDENACMINLGFEEQNWDIHVKWALGTALFDEEWNFFMKDANVSLGDTILLEATDEPLKFKVCIFHASLLQDNVSTEGLLNDVGAFGKFFKVVSEHTLEFGQLEVPHVFVSKYGGQITKKLNICLGGGMNAKFKFCPVECKIYGMHRFLRKYEVDEEFLLLFNYKGNSTFELSVFDNQWMNHFRNCFGNYRFEDFMFPPPGAEVLDLSDSMDVISDVYDSETDTTEDSGTAMSSDSTDMSEDSSNIDEDYERFSFTVNIKKSHLDQRCHGAYLGKRLAAVYNLWGNRTMTTLIMDGRECHVEALRTKKQCRFCSGWNDFVRANNVRMNDELFFQYVGDFEFQVQKV